MYVTPLIEFAVPVWCPYLKSDIVQSRVKRMLPGFKKLPYCKRLRRLKITDLEIRRKIGDLKQVFKIFDKHEKIDLC